jgi:hypothetical protein
MNRGEDSFVFYIGSHMTLLGIMPSHAWIRGKKRVKKQGAQLKKKEKQTGTVLFPPFFSSRKRGIKEGMENHERKY